MTETEKAQWRLDTKTLKGGPEDCWLWQGSLGGNGYAHMSYVDLYGRRYHTGNGHVVAWALANGRWPREGMHIMHTCDNSRCVNPAHLEEGTPKQNAQDRPRTGRWHSLTTGKLTPEQVLRIRNTATPQVELAEEFGVSQAVISRVRNGKAYAADGTKRRSVPPRRERGTRSKLSDAQVREIRRRASDGENYRDLATTYGTHPSTMHRIVMGKSYIHVRGC